MGLLGSAAWRWGLPRNSWFPERGPCCPSAATSSLPACSPQIWNDYKLKWDPSEYDGAEFMRVPAQKIWKPDIVLYNK